MSRSRIATTSSWVIARTMSRSPRSLNRTSSGPIFAYRPLSFHTSAGWTTGISISCPPIAFDLLADDLLDAIADPLAERQQRIDPGAELAKVARPEQQPMARHLGVAGIVAERGEEQLGEAHGAKDSRRAPVPAVRAQATGRDSETRERWPGRPCPPGAELQPAERIGDPHRACCLANLVGRHDVERLAGERGGQPGAAADRGEVSPYKPDLAHECPLGPGCWQRSRVAESMSQTERLSRQRPPGAGGWTGTRVPPRGGEPQIAWSRSPGRGCGERRLAWANDAVGLSTARYRHVNVRHRPSEPAVASTPARAPPGGSRTARGRHHVHVGRGRRARGRVRLHQRLP